MFTNDELSYLSLYFCTILPEDLTRYSADEVEELTKDLLLLNFLKKQQLIMLINLLDEEYETRGHILSENSDDVYGVVFAPIMNKIEKLIKDSDKL